MKFNSTIITMMLASAVLTGCTQTAAQPQETPAEQTEQNTEATEDSKEIVFLAKRLNEDTIAMRDKAEAEINGAGYSITTYDAWNDAEKQKQLVRRSAEDGAAALIVQLVHPQDAADLIAAAGEIPIVFLDNAPTDMALLNAENVAYCGSDEQAAGYIQGEYLKDYFRSIRQKEIHCIWLENLLDTELQEQRSAGVRQALEDNGIVMASEVRITAKTDRADAMQQVQTVLEAGVEFDCMIANNDALALGALDACEAMGLPIGTFPVVSIDGTSAAIRMVAQGDMAMTISKNCEGLGKAAAQAALNLIQGDAANHYTTFQKDESEATYSDSILWVSYRRVTPDNVAGYLKQLKDED